MSQIPTTPSADEPEQPATPTTTTEVASTTVETDELPDDGDLLGDDLGGEVTVDYRATRTPHAGSTKRQKFTYYAALTESMRADAERQGLPEPTPGEIAARFRSDVGESTQKRARIESALAKVAPELAAPDAHLFDRDIEVAAMRRIPSLLWIWMLMLQPKQGPKRMPMWRRLAAAAVFQIGFAAVVPCTARILSPFCKDNRFLAWTHLWPGQPPTYPPPPARRRGEKQKRWELSAFYKQVKKVLGTGLPVSVWAAANREMVLGLAGEHTVDPQNGGRFSKIRDLLTYLAVDATLIEADLDQRKPKSEVEARMMRGQSRERCGFVVYRNRLGHVFRRCHGYKWVQIVSMKAGGLPLIGGLFPANVNERAVTLLLLAQLVKLYPEIQWQKNVFLVGDSLYDHSEDFAYELLTRFGIHGVFPRHGKLSADIPYGDNGGVPRCGTCGTDMRIKERRGFPTPLYRRQNGLPPVGELILKRGADGEESIWEAAEIRWECPSAACRAMKEQDSDGSFKAQTSTYFRENSRLYTYLPHAGDSPATALRIALTCYRNLIESSFSSLKERGFGGKDQARPRWAGDPQMEHLAWMAAVATTARRYIHATDAYVRAWDEADSLGLLKGSDPTRTARVITAADWAVMEEQLLRTASAPPGWDHIDVAIDCAKLTFEPTVERE